MYTIISFHLDYLSDKFMITCDSKGKAALVNLRVLRGY